MAEKWEMPSLKCLTRYSYYIVTNRCAPSDTTVILLCCCCFPFASRHSLIEFLSTLGNFDKVNKEAVFIWWSAWFKGSGNTGLGDYWMFLFPGASKILRKRSDIIWVSAQTCTLYCFNLVTFHIRVWQLKKNISSNQNWNISSQK